MKIKQMIIICYSHNDAATWPEVLTHNMRVEMIKLGRDRFQNKEAFKSCSFHFARKPKGGILRCYATGCKTYVMV